MNQAEYHPTMTIEELADFISSHADDFGIDSIDKVKLLGELNSQGTIIDRQSFGFAVLIPQLELPAAKLLYFVWIAAGCRKQGRGKTYVRQLVKRYQGDYVVLVICYGKSRSNFFQRCGGKVLRWDRSSGRREIELGRCKQ